MKLTLLEIVQRVLDRTDGDNVNSIDDTIESSQIAEYAKSVYYQLISEKNWPHTKKFITLTSLSDTDHPTHIKLPDNVNEIITDSVWYDKQKQGDSNRSFEKIHWLDNDAFLRRVNARNSSDSEVDEIEDFDGAKLLINNDQAPLYFTSFDDQHLVLDAYDSGVESTVQDSKFQIQGYVTPSWTKDDTFVPDLPEEVFPTYLEELVSTVYFELKQQANPKAEDNATDGIRSLARKNWRVKGGVRMPNYGRRSRKGGISSPPFNDN